MRQKEVDWKSVQKAGDEGNQVFESWLKTGKLPKDEEVCPICEQGVLVETEEDFLVFSVCTHCDSEIADAEQMRINKHRYICDWS